MRRLESMLHCRVTTTQSGPQEYVLRADVMLEMTPVVGVGRNQGNDSRPLWVLIAAELWMVVRLKLTLENSLVVDLGPNQGKDSRSETVLVTFEIELVPVVLTRLDAGYDTGYDGLTMEVDARFEEELAATTVLVLKSDKVMLSVALILALVVSVVGMEVAVLDVR